MRRNSILVVAALVAGASGALADSGHDQDGARRAVEQGRMLPLRDIVARAEAAFDGQVVKAELEDEGGGPLYELKIVTRAGRVVKVRYDARTGALVTPRARDGGR